MPEEGMRLKTHAEILRLEEIVYLVEVAAGLGLSRIRFTGGEPLIRRNFAYLVSQVAAIPGINDLAMTTNGIMLTKYAEELRQAGLRRVNISLDTLDKEKFSYITRGGNLDDVREGIAAALAYGFDPVKINVVITDGLNEGEIEAFAELSREQPLHIRFIELMPLGQATEMNGGFVPVAAVLERLHQVTTLERVAVPGSGPAHYYRLPGAKGTLGFIGAISQCFCATCNRLRLTADGKLRPCLESDWEIDLCHTLRTGASREEVSSLFRLAVAAKPGRHRFGDRYHGVSERAMWQIGG
jgi:cyclic pyranopterin phosphate synthase